MVSYYHCANTSHWEMITQCVPCLSSIAWYKNQNDKKWQEKVYITHFGTAFVGMSIWNKNKICKQASELLTVTDEAFIHLCLYNYSETWKAQENKKGKENSNIAVPVSTNA